MRHQFALATWNQNNNIILHQNFTSDYNNLHSIINNDIIPSINNEDIANNLPSNLSDAFDKIENVLGNNTTDSNYITRCILIYGDSSQVSLIIFILYVNEFD
jgi:hypothetical protein